jgi:hypothetical protein
MIREIAEDVMLELMTDDVFGIGLFEFTARRDPHGRFSAAGAAGLYAHGVMAAGRVAGMEAKKKGADRAGVRTAIKAGMDTQLGKLAQAKSIITTRWGERAGADITNTLAAREPKSALKTAHQIRKNDRMKW